jgi:CheY-like chemotaxis protein
LPDHVQVDLQLTPDLPPVNADRGQLQQVLMNLVINAGEAMTGQMHGRLTIETNIAAREPDNGGLLLPDGLPQGDYISFEVRDTGKGIDEATLSHIFEPYFTTKVEGSGLGLAATAGIIKAHGGDIRVHAVVGVGSRFTVWLPALHVPLPMKKPLPISAETDENHGFILVIDDEDAVRNAVVDLLTLGGWNVLEAADGALGIALYRQRRDAIAVVLLDMRMPGMNGAETLRQLYTVNPNIKVVLTSGYGEREVLSHFDNTTHLTFLQKPYRLETLLDTISRVIHP